MVSWQADRFDAGGEVAVRGRYAPVWRIARLTAVLVALGGLVGLVQHAYRASMVGTAGDLAPLIRADTSPIKIQPEQPGGMQVPHRHVRVLQDPGSAGRLLEDPRLMEPAEQPLDWPVLAAEPAETWPVSPAAFGPAGHVPVQRVLDGSIDAAEALIMRLDPAEDRPVEPAGAEPPPAVAEPPAIEPPAAPLVEPSDVLIADAGADGAAVPAAEGQPTELALAGTPVADQGLSLTALIERTVLATPAAAAEMPQPQVAADPPAPAAAGHRVQLAAVLRADQAEPEWARFQRLYPELLADLALSVEPFQTRTGRTFYRVMGGPLDQAAAGRLCATLEQRGADCIVRR